MFKRHVLVAEDSFLIAASLESLLTQRGIGVVGPASTLNEAMALADAGGFDAAILDVNLHDEMVFPVADLLIARGIPFVFATAYAPSEILPPRFASQPTLQKPYAIPKLIALLERAFESA
ncbi:MAG: response regulator [Rhodospirillaceae bacterium]